MAIVSMFIGGVAKPASALTQNERYVTRLYNDFSLGNPTDDELLWFSTVLNNGGSRASVASAIVDSPDVVGVYTLGSYLNFLGRGPSGDEYDAAAAAKSAGDYINIELIVFSGSEYFAAAGGNNTDFLNELYLDVMQRAADPSGHAWYLNKLNTGYTRSWVATNMIRSAEASTRRIGGPAGGTSCLATSLTTPQDVTAGTYCIVLDRMADPSGLAYWSGQLQGVGNLPTAWASLAASSEYYNAS